jgi:dTDP-4-dehydrorhamnose 3,5-epimerase
MNFIPQKIPDIVLIQPSIHSDNRGFFTEAYRQDLLENFIGYKINFVQDNISKSNLGVLRGLHYQLPPFTQAKLVQVIEGRVLDVVVDIRRNSSSFGQHITSELTSENQHQLFIPHGFAHGFVALTDNAIFSYKVDNYYSKDHDGGVSFNDKKLDINWKIPYEILKVSDKDKQLPSLDMIEKLF